jgi:hypothetical protein
MKAGRSVSKSIQDILHAGSLSKGKRKKRKTILLIFSINGNLKKINNSFYRDQ